jgi:hypothetical protein
VNAQGAINPIRKSRTPSIDTPTRDSILDKISAILYDLQLNTLCVMVEIQHFFGSGEDSNPAKLIYAHYRSCVDRTAEETNAFIHALAGMCMRLNINCICHSPGRKDYVPHIFLQVSLISLIIIEATIYVSLNYYEIVFKFSSKILYRRPFYVWYIFRARA